MNDLETQAMYDRIAQEFSFWVKKAFATEDSLKEAYAAYTSLEFDRTDRWNNVLRQALRDVWRAFGPGVVSNPTSYDTDQVLRALSDHLDFNLFTQVMLNVQPWPVAIYGHADSDAWITEAKTFWEGKSPSPFDAKPKMYKVAADASQSRFNFDLSLIKAKGIIAKCAGHGARSYRVSPMGATPTLVDSENVSMIGMGGDRFLKVPEGWGAYYLTWDGAPEVVTAEGNGVFRHEFIPYPFKSSSGDPSILNASLLSREIADKVYQKLAIVRDFHTCLLPRMNSVLIMVHNTNLFPDTDSVMAEVRASTANSMELPSLKLHMGVRNV